VKPAGSTQSQDQVSKPPGQSPAIQGSINSNNQGHGSVPMDEDFDDDEEDDDYEDVDEDEVRSMHR
jgi:hypothetical protein